MSPHFALIGCGRIGRRHAEQIHKYGKLIAVCDIDEIAGKELAEEYDVPYYTSLETTLLSAPHADVVSICTPNGLHAEQSIAALKAGKHVLCEKPLAISSYDAKRMIETADRADKRLYVVKQNRYNPPVMAVKKLLKEDRLGKILSFQINCFWNRPNSYYSDSWRGTRKMDGGTLYTQFSHFIDLLYWFLGDVKTVEAVIKNFEHRVLEIEDTGMVMFQMNSGALGTLNYTVNSYQKNMEGSFTIFGEKGTVKIGGQYLNELEYQCIDGTPIEKIPSGSPANNYGFYQGSMSNHDQVYQNLVHALQDPDFEFAKAMDGYKTVDIIERIYKNASTRTH